MRNQELKQILEEAENTKKTIRDGVLNFVVSSLLYALGLFLLIKILKSGDVITWELRWIECTGIMTGFNFIRLWDRTFFR